MAASIVTESHYMDICQMFGVTWHPKVLNNDFVCKRINSFWAWAMDHEGEVEGSRRLKNIKALIDCR